MLIIKFLIFKNYFKNLSGINGTAIYFSPEIFKLYQEWNLQGRNYKLEGTYDSFTGDIFALGLICIQYLLGF